MKAGKVKETGASFWKGLFAGPKGSSGASIAEKAI